jgi:UDP-2,3-diacylglucosamine pyrophosphatase LpxH
LITINSVGNKPAPFVQARYSKLEYATSGSGPFVASCADGAGSENDVRETGRPAGERFIVISDTHFGDSSMLLDDRELVDRFTAVLSERGDVSELILLGDILDLWVKTPVPALRKARYFIESLSRLENVEKIIYVPGNHDHQMFLDAFRLEQDVRIMQGDLTAPRFMPARHYGETVISGLAHPSARPRFSMTYPFLVRDVGGREVVFAHGHHLDFYATSHGWARTFWLGRHIIKKRRRKATLHDIEMANIPFCGAMSMAPWVPELVSEGLRYYRIISFFSKLFRSDSLQESPLRDSLIRENYEEIAQLLPQLGHPRPACFIYGHTHRPGVGSLTGNGTVIANAGSWTRVEDEDVPTRTWIELDGDVKLYRLARSGAELLEAAAYE